MQVAPLRHQAKTEDLDKQVTLHTETDAGVTAVGGHPGVAVSRAAMQCDKMGSRIVEVSPAAGSLRVARSA